MVSSKYMELHNTKNIFSVKRPPHFSLEDSFMPWSSHISGMSMSKIHHRHYKIFNIYSRITGRIIGILQLKKHHYYKLGVLCLRPTLRLFICHIATPVVSD